MSYKYIFTWIYLLSACAMLAIGRVYDERLSIFGFNISILLSVVFFLLTLFFFTFIKSIVLDKNRILLFSFYMALLVINPILWTFFGASEYGVLKFLNFILITIPLSIIILEYLKYQDVKNIFIILFHFSNSY